MRPVNWNEGLLWGTPNLRWGNPSYLIEPGDPGYVPPSSPPTKKPKKKRNYMASNATPIRLDELLAAGEDLCDGIAQHAVAIGLKQNTLALARADLDSLILAQTLLVAAQGAEPTASTAHRVADSNGKGFIARAIKVLSIALGNDWSDEWLATGLPDNRVAIPLTQDARFTALLGLKGYFTANPGRENAALDLTAAIAEALHTAISNARQGVANAQSNSKAKLIARDAAKEAFKQRYRGTISELEQLLDEEDPKWYDFGLNRPADPATPGVPSNVSPSALGGGRVLVQFEPGRRSNSSSVYLKKPADAEPVKVINTEGTQHTIEGLPVGQSVAITVTGVNDAGEGQPSEPVSVVVA